jgi:hypothetical protein
LHVVPAQQVVPTPHTEPAGAHAGAAQRESPSSPAKHKLPLQHWSRNWQTAPVAMQQPAPPVYPEGHIDEYPPKQRGIPAESSLQASFMPLQQLEL